jgi:hypothetical protein
VTGAEVRCQQLVQAFERTPSLFKLLWTVRTRRMGKGFTIETGVEEIHPVAGGWRA